MGKFSPMNFKTYELLKDGKVINETEAYSADSALDYFNLYHKDFYTTNSYSIRQKKFKTQKF